jgi:hypothetical protein
MFVRLSALRVGHVTPTYLQHQLRPYLHTFTRPMNRSEERQGHVNMAAKRTRDLRPVLLAANERFPRARSDDEPDAVVYPRAYATA